MASVDEYAASMRSAAAVVEAEAAPLRHDQVAARERAAVEGFVALLERCAATNALLDAVLGRAAGHSTTAMMAALPPVQLARPSLDAAPAAPTGLSAEADDEEEDEDTSPREAAHATAPRTPQPAATRQAGSSAAPSETDLERGEGSESSDDESRAAADHQRRLALLRMALANISPSVHTLELSHVLAERDASIAEDGAAGAVERSLLHDLSV